jgi:transcriptional regulator with XRE-family HTH domain/mannose-6-phosphate isomerase-like protein (cupin superfamily)
VPARPASDAAGNRAKKRATVEDQVGKRLRGHREERDLSLRELARRLAISPSALSQIETGKSRPSVSTLYAIVTELGMSLDELFSGPGAGQAADAARPAAKPAPAPAPPVEAAPVRSWPPDQRTDGRHVQRAGTRQAIELETGVKWERLTAHADPQADFLYVVYDVDGSSCKEDRFIRHSGREYGLVLSGTLEVTVGFDRYELGPGDSICFDSTVPHCLRNIGAEPVHGVWLVIGRHDDHRTLVFKDGNSG